MPDEVENEHHAFCTRGCHGSFYLKRCLICEEQLPDKSRRQVCNRPKCKAAYRASPDHYRWSKTLGMGAGSGSCKVDARSADEMGVKNAHISDHIITGPALPAFTLHNATVGGAEAATNADRVNARHWREYSARAEARCLIQRHHPPINILGGYKLPEAPVIELALPDLGLDLEQQTRLAGLLKQIPQDLSIPEFLQR